MIPVNFKVILLAAAQTCQDLDHRPLLLKQLILNDAVAAQNCRKRKLDQIMSLADEVKQMRDRKQRLVREHDFLSAERQRVKNKLGQLYRHIFQALRDPEGNPYSPYEWSLQQAADGSVILVPRSNSTSMLEQTEPRTSKHTKEPDPDPRKQ